MEDTAYVSEQYIRSTYICMYRVQSTDTYVRILQYLKQLVCIVAFKTLGQSDNYT